MAIAFCGFALGWALLTSGCVTSDQTTAAGDPHTRGIRSAPSSLAGSIRSTAPVGPQLGTFVAQWVAQPDKTLQLERFSEQDGRPLAKVATLPQYARGSVSGPYRASDGALWLTATKGPRYRSNVVGGDPAPRSCRGAAIRLDPKIGATQKVFSVPSSQLIGDVVPSPNRQAVAFVSGGCASYLDDHIVIRTLQGKRQVTIGTGAAPCHGLGAPSWSPDSSAVVFPYAPAARRNGGPGIPRGVCPSPRSAELAILPADRSSQIKRADLVFAPKGCGYADAAYDTAGIAAIQTCGEGADQPGQDNGPAYFVQLDSARHVATRVALKPGANPATLSINPQSGQILITEYQNPRHHPPARPASEFIWTFDGEGLRLVHHFVNQGAGVPSNSTW